VGRTPSPEQIKLGDEIDRFSEKKLQERLEMRLAWNGYRPWAVLKNTSLFENEFTAKTLKRLASKYTCAGQEGKIRDDGHLRRGKSRPRSPASPEKPHDQY